ncbi:MAG: DnaJ domain-containing protein [bacterium]|nr:DnaJ domain-containing protein [bacterium]
MEGQWIDAPDEGGLDAVSVPQILAQAWRDERTGLLALSHGQRERKLLVRAGAPISISAPRNQDEFAAFLANTGRIDGTQRVEVERLAAERGCPQVSAVLALELLDPKALYLAMRAETRARIADTFEWGAGQYRWTEAPPEADDPKTARPFDLLALLQEELPRRWGTDRLFGAIVAVEGLHGDITPRHRKVTRKLAEAGDMAARAIAGLDGTRPIGRVLGDCAGDPLAAATLWAVVFSGVLRRIEPPTEATETRFDFEVEVAGAGASTAARPAAATKTAGAASAAGSNPKAEALREEIDALRGQLADLDHYAALGLEEDAGAAQIKKAYFKAAKKYHPDALGRLGLDDHKEAAAQVFARIAEAFEVLSDPDKKKAYDAGGSEELQIDTARLAQAETSYRKGEILAKMGNFEGALEYFEPAVELWPDEPAYQMGLGWALFKQPRSDHARALQHLEIALEQAPDEAVVLYRLGLVLRAAGETNRANELIARARAIDPDVAE